MGRYLFDFDDKDPIFTLDDDIGIDSDGYEMMRIDDNYAVDLRTNEIHFTDRWETQDEIDDFDSDIDDLDELDSLGDDVALDFGNDFFDV